jgi:hypothetical protein
MGAREKKKVRSRQKGTGGGKLPVFVLQAGLNTLGRLWYNKMDKKTRS